MRTDERELLRLRYRYRCGYCGVAEEDAGAELTRDHFHPRSRGGGESDDNWVYSCHSCNEFKSDFWSDDPSRRLLHPLLDNLTEHILENSEGKLVALTPRGEAHIDRLHLNRPQLVAYRLHRRLLAESKKTQSRLLESLAKLEETMKSLTEELTKLRGP